MKRKYIEPKNLKKNSLFSAYLVRKCYCHNVQLVEQPDLFRTFVKWA